MGKVLGVVIYRVMSHDCSRVIAYPLSGVRVHVEGRKVAVRYVQTEFVPCLEEIAHLPKINSKLVYLASFDQY